MLQLKPVNLSDLGVGADHFWMCCIMIIMPDDQMHHNKDYQLAHGTNAGVPVPQMSTRV
jgi:hypothetical protein